MLQLRSIGAQPSHRIPYLNAGRGGRTETETLSIERAVVAGLPPNLDALVLTSDLQGSVPARGTGEAQLLGVAVADALLDLAEQGVLPRTARTGAVLAGDLYSVPAANKRGGYGDVSAVWEAFAETFTWVAGVLGNHDDLGGDHGVARLERRGNVHLLDGRVAEVDGLRIGGVGLITGDPEKRGRRAEDDQLALIELVAEQPVDLLALHEGPSGDREQPGHAGIRAIVERYRVPLTVCGHCHWPQPVATHEHGWIANVDARVLVLTR